VITIFGDSYIETEEALTQQLQSKTFTVMDARTGFVLYENAQHELMYPASITKIMTALLVLEEIDDLQQELIFSEHAVMSLPYYAGRLNMMAGDTITVYEALYGLMLRSGNDVANALAEHVSGDIGSFVARMNSRAAELGAVNTHFVNPCGLPGNGQHTTAYDMALIMQEAINHPAFNALIAAPNFYISPTETFPEGLTVRNTNMLIQPESEYHNPSVLGGKTGFTNAAMHTLVSHAQQGDHNLIVSVLYAPRGATFTDTTYLLDHAFTLPIQTLFEAGNHQWEVPVIQDIDGELTEIGIVTARGQSDLRLPMIDAISDIRYEVHIPDILMPPIQIGETVGHKSFYLDETFIGTIELISTQTVSSRMAITPSIQQATPPYAITAPQPMPVLLSFLIVVPIIIFALTGIVLIQLHKRRMRHRKLMMRRKRREMVRMRYAQYQFSE